jgi:hypothetical protein
MATSIESFRELRRTKILRGVAEKQEGCWLQRRKLRVHCKGEKIPFPLMSKGERKEIGGGLYRLA